MATVSIADQLKVLIELQKLDAEIYQKRKILQARPAEAARLKEEHNRALQAVQATETQYKALEVKRNQRETDLGQKEEQVKKLQVQLYQVKTNKEYSTLQKEIEGLKADKSVFEEEILNLMEEVDHAKAQLASARERLKVQEVELAGQLKAIEVQTEEIKDSIQRMQTLRVTMTPKIDPPVLTQYERILERKEGSALVPIRGDACGGCHMVLPPQVINEVQMNTRLVPCESCARILYIEPSD